MILSQTGLCVECVIQWFQHLFRFGAQKVLLFIHFDGHYLLLAPSEVDCSVSRPLGPRMGLKGPQCEWTSQVCVHMVKFSCCFLFSFSSVSARLVVVVVV